MKKVLLLNQTFHPDVVSTAQHLTSLGEALAARGAEVTALSSRRAYDAPATRFPRRETYRKVKIERITATGFGKGAKWRRILDFGSFLLSITIRLIFSPKADVIVALTSPPLIAALAAIYKRLRGARFVYWVMDLNPDEALAAGWLKPGLIAWSLERISRFTFRSADAIIVLDRFMYARVLSKNVAPERVHILPPWSFDEYVYFNAEGRERFRRRHGLTDKFVVMYSGNHSPCHPLDTLLDAATALASDDRFRFLFVGGGSEYKKLQQTAQQRQLSNVLFLPYQPLESLSDSLSAADLQTVVMGTRFVGIIHPCKLYSILAVNAPILSIGPGESHVTDALGNARSTASFIHIAPGDTETLVAYLQASLQHWSPQQGRLQNPIVRDFGAARLLPEMADIILR
ncbi:MAG: glycosyltransferase family 4 protein [Acidobacteriaceae bacterium]